MPNEFNQKLKSGAKPIGTFVTLDSPEVAELLSLCGYDWLLFDMEHAIFDVRSVQRLVQATRPDCSTIVRVPENSPGWIKKVLDTGCDGIMVPHVNSVEDAQAAVAASKYPPLGSRGVGVGRAHGYGTSFESYMQSANTSVTLMIQIEHKDAVADIDAILDVEGIDAVLIGPFDLSGSMNLLGQVAHEAVQEAISKTKQACIQKNIPVGIFVMKPEEAANHLKSGCNFVAFGVDTVMLMASAKSNLKIARG